MTFYTIKTFVAHLNPQVEETQALFKSPVMGELSSSDSTSLAGPNLSPVPSKVIQDPDGEIHVDKVNSGASDAFKTANTPLKPHSDDVYVRHQPLTCQKPLPVLVDCLTMPDRVEGSSA